MPQNFSSRFRHAARLTSARFPFYIPLAILCLMTLVLRLTNLDLQISGYFYDTQLKQWPLADKNPWEIIDQYCVFPGIILGVSAIIFSSYGLIWRQWNHWTRGAFLIATVFLIGPGLLVNGTMKPIFSRPRPREVIPMGGEQAYQPVLGFGEKINFNASFPSGHASIGFFLITPAFLIRRKYRVRQLMFFSGLLFGSMMALSRIVQGGHYFSDVLWSLGIVYLTAWATLVFMLTDELRKTESHSLKADFSPSNSSGKPPSVKKLAA